MYLYGAGVKIKGGGVVRSGNLVYILVVIILVLVALILLSRLL